MYILGLNAYHGDSSAALVKDGELVAALEEERIRRVKHWAGLPTGAIRFCLEDAGIEFSQIDCIAIGRDPQAHFASKVKFTLFNRPSISLVWNRLKNLGKVSSFVNELADEFDVDAKDLMSKVEHVEHHRAHLANAFFISPYDRAAVVSVDGMGDFVSTMWGTGRGNKIEVDDFVEFPHSLGYFYTAITQHLGFWHYGDEYKVMGLSAAGDANKYIGAMRKIVLLQDDGTFKLNLDYFSVLKSEAKATWNGQAPTVGKFFSKRLEQLLGPARKEGEDLNDRHKNIAAACQAMYEEALFHILNHVQAQTGENKLCLAGGTAQNSLANGKILENTDFEEVFVPPSAHDGGNAVGAAYYVWNQTQEQPRGFIMKNPFLGPEYFEEEISEALERVRGLADSSSAQAGSLQVGKLSRDELIAKTAQLIADGNVVGWFQGRSEWGPRALGNRSILANPRRSDMKDIINRKIKYREPFRPFAPSILADRAEEYFTGWQTGEISNAPLMERVYMIRKDKQKEIPAVTHLDGSGRLQTVERDFNPRYYDLIKKFGDITGTPVVLNTSFNENEPIVNTPQEAIDCFLRTDMDAVVLGDYLITKSSSR